MMGLPAKDAEVYFFYRQVVALLNRNLIPFLMGGGFAFEYYTRVGRSIKDMDVFLCRDDVERAFRTLNEAGFQTELTFPHWLGKVFHGSSFIDVIFSSGNGLCEVDGRWFEHARPGQVFGFPVKFCPPEEMIWSKAFIMERERYDGGDIAHLLLTCGNRLDWDRLVDRFGSHWRVLLSHLILFGYIYPSERSLVPAPILRLLLARLEDELGAPDDAQFCRGPLLSRSQYRVDVERLGYRDARILPEGNMSPQETAHWTAAADAEEPSEA
jgi:hypothetical protein